MIKVFQVSSDTNIGGAGKCILTFLRFCDKKEFEVSVVLPQNSLLTPLCKKEGAKVFEVDAMADKSMDFSAVKKLVKLFKKEKPDIVHAHASAAAKIAAKLCGIKVVYTRHSVFNPPKKLTRGPGKLLCGAFNNFTADKIIAVAEAAKDNLTKTGVSEKKITVVLNGVEPVLPCSEEEKKEIKKSFGIDENCPVVSIVARLNPVKGHEYFVRAAKILKDKGIKAKFVIAGCGEEEKNIKELIKSLDLSDTVVMTGFLNDVSRLLNITDVQANCSFGTEATSLSLLEGMSLGIPAAVTDFGGNPGVIQNGVNGLLVPVKNAEKTAQAIESLLCDKNVYKKMRENCFEIYKQKFTSRIYAKNIEDVYKSLKKV